MDVTSDKDKLTDVITECLLHNNWRQLTMFGQKHFTFVKTYKTVVGNRDAVIYPWMWKDDEHIVASFRGDFTSAGDNSLAVMSNYLKHGMTLDQVSNVVRLVSRDADLRISKSYAVKLLRFVYKPKGTFLKLTYRSVYLDRRLMSKADNPVSYCSSCQCEHIMH
ncbi:MAG: hypothetical protein EOO52_13700 [Gammaproteobacteria bacterium]|nr:MAG: hypothetical protein EOO52_13700 [Gammaproteobacteria bacterium]